MNTSTQNNNQSILSEVNDKVDGLYMKIAERDNRITNLDRTVSNLSTSMKYMKLDLQKNERERQ